eukprot:TRINITY_DN13510_c0_g1_i1.p1 TRINITY_DN13510_c0_g1~~TRINITY_DN13510_c0_g1_i1.p1  ORF type:complete len:129 (-),score=22.02 TRINITY_DN13510_c0_g1_i1:100-486(-)
MLGAFGQIHRCLALLFCTSTEQVDLAASLQIGSKTDERTHDEKVPVLCCFHQGSPSCDPVRSVDICASTSQTLHHLKTTGPRCGHQRSPSELSLIHISEPTRLLSISYAVFCLKKKKKNLLISYFHYV